MNSTTSTVHREGPQRTTAATGERERETERERDGSERFTCPECDGRIVDDEERGEAACAECGLVVDADAIDHGPEWRAFDGEETDARSRVGAPTTNLMHDKGLSSVIGWRNEDANGRTLSARKRERLSRLRTWDERFRARDSRDRNLKHALGEIDRMASALGLPKNVRETAGVVYRRALEADLLRGRSIEGMATASLYAAARQAGLPRSLEEVAQVSRVEKLRIQRSYQQINRELGLRVAPPDPTDYVARFASELGLNEEARRVACELLDAAVAQNRHSGKSPTALAAGAVYAAGRLTNQRVTQQRVSDVSRVARATVRHRYHELLEAQEARADAI